MTAPIQVAAIQLAAHDRSAFARSLDAIVEATRRAAADSDLVVLPEATIPAYVLGSAQVDDGAITNALDRLRAIAQATTTVIVAGGVAVSENGLRNTAFVIDSDGSLAGRADKLFLWHFDRRWFTPGNRLQPVSTTLGSLGVLVCADGRLPTIARTLVDRGATALIMPTAWVTSGRDPDALENVQADLLGRVRAYENGVPFVAANKCGSELGMVAYCGKSQIVDAGGEVVAIAGEREPQMLRAAITLASKTPQRAVRPDPPPAHRIDAPVRLAISCDPLPADVDKRLELLDDAWALSPHERDRAGALADVLPVAWVDDASVRDPSALPAYRRAGYSLLCWSTDVEPSWSERLARARALELRVYVVVFESRRHRAYAVDPDGAIVAGTFGDFRLASFIFDARRTADTVVAPGTDVAEGLQYVADITD